MRLKPYLPIALVACAVALWLAPGPAAHAQQAAKVLSTCGTASYTAGTTNYETVDTTGASCGTSSGLQPAPYTATSTDHSGTVTAGAVYQTIVASSATRKGCTVQNPPTATEILNVRVGTTTVFYLGIGSTFTCAAPGGVVASDAIAVTAATAGHAFSANSQ